MVEFDKSRKDESFKNTEHKTIRNVATEEEVARNSTEVQQANNRNTNVKDHVSRLSIYRANLKLLKKIDAENVSFPLEINFLGSVLGGSVNVPDDMFSTSPDKNLAGYSMKQYATNSIFEPNIVSISTLHSYNHLKAVSLSYFNNIIIAEGFSIESTSIEFKSAIDSEQVYCTMKCATMSIHTSKIHNETLLECSNKMLPTLAETSKHYQQGLEIVFALLSPVECNGLNINAIDRNSKNRGKLSIRLNVITPDDFRDAIRNWRASTYELSYSRFFPSNCRMFIEIPINKNGFIGRSEEKEIHYI